jgi:Protein of unknown function (DUF1569)
MNVHQMVCHLNDSYQVALTEKPANSVSGLLQRTIIKWVALKAPMHWPKGVPTLPEVEQGKGGSMPVEFRKDTESLQDTLTRFCAQLPRPLPRHAIFGAMSREDWMRWGYLHADHHLRQFGR